MKNISKAVIAAGLSVFVFSAFTKTAPPKHHKSTALVTDSAKDLFDVNEKPQLISDQFAFTEGVSVDKKGNVFFTDQPNDKIWKYDTDGKLSVFLDKTGRANGTYFDKKGNLITCSDEKDQLWSISPKGKIKVILNDYQGKLFNGPNDVWIDPKGGIYLSDPFYRRDYWTRRKPDLDGQKVYYLPKGATQAVIVVDDMRQPNGIVGSPDGKYLLVADLGANKTYKYIINKDGSLSDKKLLIMQGSDGMTIDSHENIYLTGNGVTIYSPEGVKIANIPNKDKWTGNVCFGGKNKDVLFITASKCLYKLQMKLKGVE